MKNIVIFTIIFLVVGCKERKKQVEAEKHEDTTVTTEGYELIKSEKSKALLIVFPAGGTTSKETKESFKIVEPAINKSISVLLMNFNRHLWIDSKEKEDLSTELKEIIERNDLNTDRIFIGGMSIGGTVAITLSNYLTKINSSIKPKGIFIVDSPIDLYSLYESSQKDAERKDFSEERLAEPKFIIQYFENEFGNNDSLFTNIQNVSPVTLKTQNIENIMGLKNTKLRFYTEPDTLWWKDNRQTDFKNTNAYTLQKTAEVLKNRNWNHFQLIQTKNKGYRADGKRHPHSWSIVDKNDLLDWILE